MSTFVQSADVYVAEALRSWNIYTTVLAVLLTGLLTYPVFFPSEPDTHPLLLARQSIAAQIRRKGESASYRASEVPHGYPLRTGLNVKDASAPRWAGGKDGDLRDVWREVARAGGVGPDGREVPRGSIMRILGKDVEEREIEDLSKEIIIVGKHFKSSGIKKLAIYLPNDVEYLLAVFACSFYGISPILLPFNLPHAKVYDLIKKTSADGVICAAGSLPLADIAKQCTGVRLLNWVVEKTSQHMDWRDPEDSVAKHLTVSAWHDLVSQGSAASTELPTNEGLATPPELVAVWQGTPTSGEDFQAVSFSHANLVAGIAGIITSLPLRQRFGSSDLVVPADSFCNTYALCCTLAALFSHAGVALNSVAGRGVDLTAATLAVKPTVIIASAESIVDLHVKESARVSNALHKLGMAVQSQTLSTGRMPSETVLSRVLGPSTSQQSGKLRLILASERIAGGSPPLTSKILADIRIFTRARLVYALTAAKVAGAIAQSNIFDYRIESGSRAGSFGSPVSSVEVKVASTTEKDIAGSPQGVAGELVVSGPAVVGGIYHTAAKCTIRTDGTIAIIHQRPSTALRGTVADIYSNIDLSYTQGENGETILHCIEQT